MATPSRASFIASAMCSKDTCSREQYWPRPEASVPHSARDVPPIVDAELLDKAFPDLNCDRADGGRWRAVRLELELLIDAGFAQESAAAFLRWQDVLDSLERLHGLSGWLYPLAGPDWVEGHGVADVLGNFSQPVPCVLGVATLVLISLLVTLAGAVERSSDGREALIEWLNIDHYRKAHVLQTALKRTFPRVSGGHGMITLLPAIRWPLLDLLAAAEKMLLGTIHDVTMFDARGGDCVKTLDKRWRYFVELSNQIADAPDPTDSGNVAHRSFASGNRLVSLYRGLHKQRRDAGFTDGVQQTNYRCMPRLLVYELLSAFFCAQQQTIRSDHPDPEDCLGSLNEGNLVGLFTEEQNLPYWLLFMDLSRFRLFGIWKKLRQLLFHRLELPFMATSELGRAFGIRVRTCREGACSTSSLQDVSTDVAGFHNANAAFDSLKARHSEQGQALALRSPVFLTACWGKKYASRLGLWLSAAHRVDIAEHTVVMCHDVVALSTCSAVHPWPELCADARTWPRTLMSKLVGLSLCLQRGLDVMWLDSDAVILRDPRPHLKPIGGGDAELLFSVEPSSWNCINAGVFFVQATSVTQRYLAYWISLLLERPSVIDQTVVFLLLGLFPKMDYPAFLAREQLLDSGPRPAAFGSLQTPVWGALDSQSTFGMTSKVTYGGFLHGGAQDLAVLHMLESWPNESVVWPIYQDIQDPVATILEGLAGQGRGWGFSMELIKRSQSTFPNLRSCHTSFTHGR